MRKPQLVALLIITTMFALTACGQKGALYLPADESAQVEATASAVDDETPKKKEE